ncbi:MAG: hypothetical protein LBS60_00500, partial [Deltaproteobacteria bacterium]|nr:hypothetical protein [Deltaproteobacteria bacterium]
MRLDAYIQKVLEYVASMAENGDVNAANLVVEGLYAGIVNLSPESSLEWLVKAAESGSAEANALLGDYYKNGLDGPPEPTKAFNHYLTAAEKGYSRAQVR